MIADEGGVKVSNPVRTFEIPWGAVHGIYLADSVEVSAPGPRPGKIRPSTVGRFLHLGAPGLGAQLRAWQWDQGKRTEPNGYT